MGVMCDLSFDKELALPLFMGKSEPDPLHWSDEAIYSFIMCSCLIAWNA